MLSQLEAQREVSAFDEKVTLAKLEVAKAQERVAELEYQKARFVLDLTSLLAKDEAQAIAKANQTTVVNS